MKKQLRKMMAMFLVIIMIGTLLAPLNAQTTVFPTDEEETEKTAETDRFQEVINGINFKAFNSVFTVSGSKYDLGFVSETFIEFYPIDIWHIDVKKHQFDLFMDYAIHGL